MKQKIKVETGWNMLSKILKFLIYLLCIFSLSYGKVKALFIFSYTLDEPNVYKQYKGSLKALKDFGFEIKAKAIELDYRHLPKEEFQKKVKKAIEEIQKYKPQVVFLYDDPAFSYLLPYVKDKNYYVIFSGINKNIELYNRKYNLFDKNGHPLSNIIGVLEPLFINEIIATGIYTFGDAKEYPFLVSNDITGQSVLSEALLYLKDNPKFLKKTSIYTFSELRDYISFLESLNKDKNNKYIIHAVFKLKKEKNKYAGVKELINETLKHYFKPTLGVANSWVKLGLTLGVSCDFYDMGYKAGKLASNLLQGYPIFFFKFQKEDKKELVINRRSFRKLNKKLPLGLIFASDEIY